MIPFSPVDRHKGMGGAGYGLAQRYNGGLLFGMVQ
jgi:hypothetical protein